MVSTITPPLAAVVRAPIDAGAVAASNASASPASASGSAQPSLQVVDLDNGRPFALGNVDPVRDQTQMLRQDLQRAYESNGGACMDEARKIQLQNLLTVERSITEHLNERDRPYVKGDF